MDEGRVEKEVQRRTIVKGAAWSVPVIAAAVSAPAASSSPQNETPKPTRPTNLWKIDVIPTCGTFFGWTSGLGFRIKNTGTDPVPPGTKITWTVKEGVWTNYFLSSGLFPSRIPNLVVEAFYKQYVNSGNPPLAYWYEAGGRGITTTNWSNWYRGEDEQAAPQHDLIMQNGYWSYRDKTVIYTVPPEGLAPEHETYYGYNTNFLWPNFKAFMTKVTGSTNGGTANAAAKPAWLGCETQRAPGAPS